MFKMVFFMEVYVTDKKIVKKIESQLESLLEPQGYVETHIAGQDFDAKLEKKILTQEKVSRKDHGMKAEQNAQTQNPIKHASTNRGN